MELENQIAVVTGAAQGIGFAVVQQLVDKGVKAVSYTHLTLPTIYSV